MCLAIPGKIKSIDKKISHALVNFSGIEREVNISLVEAKKGDYVIVHAGFAIQKINQREALKVKSYLKIQSRNKISLAVKSKILSTKS